MSAVAEPEPSLGVRGDAPHTSARLGRAGRASIEPPDRPTPARGNGDSPDATVPPADGPEADAATAEVPSTEPAEPPLPELGLREPLPAVIETQAALDDAAARLAAGTGPIALDTERASGYRYGQRAYLIQARREGAGTVLVDPIAVPDLTPFVIALADSEWILHAASQDLPCLAELGMRPSALFDTELAGRLLGMERVGLAPMVAAVMGKSLRKGHGAADWSTRPLPREWLEYAALDVEVLIELREHLSQALDEAGKLGWAMEEFAAIRDAPPPEPRVEPWRRTSGLHRARGRRSLAIVAAMWQERDRIAREKDVAPGRLLPDSALVAAAVAQPRDVGALLALPGFKGRGAARHRAAWALALDSAWALTEAQLPDYALRGGGPPPPRQWLQRDPVAARRLDLARADLRDLSDRLSVPVENLLQPDLVRRLLWGPSARGEQDVSAWLSQNGARPWQVGLTAPILAAAIEAA